jgi:dihydroorotase
MRWVTVILLAPALAAQPAYDLLLRNGHVIDPKNGTSEPRDVAVKDGKIASVAARIDPSQAKKVVDVLGLYVAPGLIDLHTHIVPGAGLRGSLPIDQNVYPDSHTLRSCVTTAVDAGTTGWRTFPAFKEKIAGQVYTRVFAMLNIVGAGQGGGESEQNVADMDPEATAAAVKANPELIVGIKTAHYRGPEWVAVERSVKAGELAGAPVMVDYGAFRPERPFQELVLKKLRPGDIYTHTYLGAVPMLDESGKVLPYLFEAQRRGVKFDAGHGGGSFLFRQAAPAIRQGFLPDSISTDLHTGSMNGAMNNMLNVMSKFLNMGMKLEDVIERSTWNPARQIQRRELGHLSVGAPADISVIRLETGAFGFVDVGGGRLTGTRRLACEMTVRDGRVVYDLNGLTRTEWDRLDKNYGGPPDRSWDWVIGSPMLGLNAPAAQRR